MSGYVQTIITNKTGIILCHVSKHARILDCEIEVRDMISSLFESELKFGGSFADIRNIKIVTDMYEIGIYVESKKPRYCETFAINCNGDVIR